MLYYPTQNESIMKIAKDITELIGRTPLIRLNSFSNDTGCELLAKLEYQNPGGSVKDRLALGLIRDAEERGIINKQSTIIEPTSGNTGIGLAMISAARGYKLIITMPESTSVERRKLIEAYGATVVLTPADEGMHGAIHKAEELQQKNPGSYIPYQFRNPANAEIHRKTTGPEIWNDTRGRIEIFVAGVGTGGTITGAGEYLKSMNPEIRVVAVEPAGSPVLSGGSPGKHKIAGIGAGFVPEVFNRNLPDEIITVQDADAFEITRSLCRREGVFGGVSSGAILWAALQLASRSENKGKTIVMITCDTGERYLSTNLFENE